MKKWAIATLLAGTVSLAACSSDKTDSATDAFKGQSAQEIFQKGDQSLAKKSYKNAIKNFEGLAALYPFSDYQEQAQLDLMYAYYMDQDYDSCGAAADRFIHLYPRSANVDYAYYMKGISDFSIDRTFGSKLANLDLSSRDLSTTKQAFNDFSQLVTLYPDSIYAPSAHARMIYLRNLLANHEVEVATFYMKHQAYVAAINRANYVVQHYQESPAVIPALGILATAYHKLQLNDQAAQITAVLALNYPNSTVYKDLMKAYPSIKTNPPAKS
ncbi:MAG: outer membrane protein assembly factor BamD [Gammaproteobacteria bacterium]|nr:outer membrane protein assembly factor BamD [Gammaproteobacteria bacterium]